MTCAARYAAAATVLALLAACCAAAPVRATTTTTTPPLPPMPETFSLTIEANLLERNHTAHFRQYHDRANARERFEYKRRNGLLYIEIVDYTTRVRHEVVKPEHGAPLNCTTSPLTDDAFFGHMRNFSELFRFGAGVDAYDYRGVHNVRGIQCDMWSHRFTGAPPFASSSPRGHDVVENITVDIYFSTAAWALDHPNQRRVPVRTHVYGSVDNVRGSNATYVMNHHYEIIDFDAAPIEPWRAAHLFVTCAAFNDDDDDDDDNDASGAAASPSSSSSSGGGGGGGAEHEDDGGGDDDDAAAAYDALPLCTSAADPGAVPLSPSAADALDRANYFGAESAVYGLIIGLIIGAVLAAAALFAWQRWRSGVVTA